MKYLSLVMPFLMAAVAVLLSRLLGFKFWGWQYWLIHVLSLGGYLIGYATSVFGRS